MLLTAPTIYTSPTIPKKSLNLPLYARFTIRGYNSTLEYKTPYRRKY